MLRLNSFFYFCNVPANVLKIQTFLQSSCKHAICWKVFCNLPANIYKNPKFLAMFLQTSKVSANLMQTCSNKSRHVCKKFAASCKHLRTCTDPSCEQFCLLQVCRISAASLLQIFHFGKGVGKSWYVCTKSKPDM